MPSQKTKRKNTTSSKESPAISVRMYRQGLGDCFLITIPAKSGEEFHMMIDCGVVLGTPDPSGVMEKVVQDIIDTTGGEVDLLVVTHEHWDHVSGFNQAEKLFSDKPAEGKLHPKQVWFAWTEDPKDKLATKLRAERRGAEDAVRMAVQLLGLGKDIQTTERVDSLVGFFGPASGSTSAALAKVKALVNGKPRFCQPGEPPIVLSEIPSVRFWVLGPPKDEKLIKKSNPVKGEAYGLDAGPEGSQQFLISGLVRGMGQNNAALTEDSIEEPFDPMYAIPMARAEHVPFFEQRYFGPSTDEGVYDRSKHTPVRDQSWRRVDSTWLESSETMALQLDSATNNTSLVLAIEIIATGEILLFPGDAQAGNWLSWQQLQWELTDPKSGEKKRVTGPDLLARTIFYKAGHHGSHNATLKEKGLELMMSDDLVVMIPVDHDMAVKKSWGRMPLPDLVERLNVKAKRRVLRIDDPVQTDADLIKSKPKDVSAAEWAAFTARVKVNKLYFDLRFF